MSLTPYSLHVTVPFDEKASVYVPLITAAQYIQECSALGRILISWAPGLFPQFQLVYTAFLVFRTHLKLDSIEKFVALTVPGVQPLPAHIASQLFFTCDHVELYPPDATRSIDLSISRIVLGVLEKPKKKTKYVCHHMISIKQKQMMYLLS